MSLDQVAKAVEISLDQITKAVKLTVVPLGNVPYHIYTLRRVKVFQEKNLVSWAQDHKVKFLHPCRVFREANHLDYQEGTPHLYAYKLNH